MKITDDMLKQAETALWYLKACGGFDGEFETLHTILQQAARRTTPDREAIIEECAKVCDEYAADQWSLYKARAVRCFTFPTRAQCSGRSELRRSSRARQFDLFATSEPSANRTTHTSCGSTSLWAIPSRSPKSAAPLLVRERNREPNRSEISSSALATTAPDGGQRMERRNRSAGPMREDRQQDRRIRFCSQG